jgi:arylsulfatase A-like enzyme
MLLHYWDVHPPYLPPEEYKTFEYEDKDESLSEYFGRDAKGPLSAAYQSYARGDQTTMAESKEAYDGAVAWVDEQFGRLLSFLRTEELLDETMIVVTADHGHNFGEHGIFSDNCGLYDTSIHVPLIVHHPAAQGDRVDGIVQHTDVVPTVLDGVGIDCPDDLRGNVLPATREFAFAEAIENRIQMVRTIDWKLMVPRDTEYFKHQYWYTGDGSAELYDLTNDPDETRNVATENSSVVERLQQLLETELATQERVAEKGSKRTADIEADGLEDVKERLNALGYADDGNV